LVLGTSPLNPLRGVKTIRVQTAEQMFHAVTERQQDQELFLMTAAVSDYRPDSYSEQKIKKSAENTSMQLNLVRTPDILAHLGQTKKDWQTVIGFALESEKATEYARQKLKKKNADAIVMNSLADAGAGFGHDTNKATLFCADGATEDFPLMTKNELSARLLTIIREKYLT
jgi:phosphopantothenoylcysteine decarboxylase/phosphopantothenate--cysteine ligase